MVAFNRTRARAILDRVQRADTPWSRAVGLLGHKRLEPGEGLWIEPCAMVHTFFMRFPIDVLFLDRELRVLRLVEDLKPWRFSPWLWAGRSVLEAAAGSLRGLAAPGDQLEMR